MLFGGTCVNYYDRMIQQYLQEHFGSTEIPAGNAPNSYMGSYRVDEFCLMYAMHDIKIDSYAIDTNRVDNLLMHIRNYITTGPECNLRLFFVKEQTDFIDSWFDGTEGNFASNPAIDVIVKQTEDALNKYEYGTGLKLRIGFLENNVIIMSNRNLDRNRYANIFLGLAIIPMQYEAIKEQMTEVELTLCKQMIRYTQLSRKPKQDLLNAVRDVEVQRHIQDIIEEMNKEQYFIMLKDVITEAPRIKLQNAKQQFDTMKTNYVEALSRLQQCEREYFAATMEGNEETIEGIRTFLKHPNIFKMQRDNNRLYIFVKAPLDIYDPEYAECILNSMPDDENFKRLWKLLYEKEKGYFISSSVYVLQIGNDPYATNRIQVLRDRPYSDDRQEYKLGFNPHHFFFNCLGQFEVTIHETIKNNNFTVLGDLLATCTRSINLADTAVLNRFKEYLNNYANQIYVMYEGEAITAAEALAKEVLEEVHNEEDSD